MREPTTIDQAMSQLSFASSEYAMKKKCTRREQFLGEMERIVPWARLLTVIEPLYPKSWRVGRPSFGLANHDIAKRQLLRLNVQAASSARKAASREAQNAAAKVRATPVFAFGTSTRRRSISNRAALLIDQRFPEAILDPAGM